MSQRWVSRHCHEAGSGEMSHSSIRTEKVSQLGHEKLSQAVLQIRDVYPRFRILIFTHPGSRIQKQLQKRGVNKKISCHTVPNMGLGSRIRDPGSGITDPGVKKAPDPGSGSATLVTGGSRRTMLSGEKRHTAGSGGTVIRRSGEPCVRWKNLTQLGQTQEKLSQLGQEEMLKGGQEKNVTKVGRRKCDMTGSGCHTSGPQRH